MDEGIFTYLGLCFIRSLQIAQALQVQMEVQRKIHEQIEVKHVLNCSITQSRLSVKKKQSD